MDFKVLLKPINGLSHGICGGDLSQDYLIFGMDDAVFNLKLLCQINDMVLELDFSRSCSSQSLLEVVDFLLELDGLVLFFVQQVRVVHRSLSSGLVSDGVVDPFSQQAFHFGFKE